MIRHLPRTVPEAPGRPEGAGPDHPMRAVTRDTAFNPASWTPERAARVAELFDGLAGEWHTRSSPYRNQPLQDALARGGPFGPGPAVDVGSGIGLSTPVLADAFPVVVSVDLSREMLARSPASAPRVQADAARLPVRSGGVGTLVLVNALLFPGEAHRVLAPGGAIVWVNSSGDRTPIHLAADDVAAALPGTWDGVWSEAGWGIWAVLRRAR